MLNAWRGGARVEYINACFCRAVVAGAGRREEEARCRRFSHSSGT